MTAEFSRRRFVIMASVAAAGLLLPESEGLDRRANSSDLMELREFLGQEVLNQEVTRPTTANLLALVGRPKPSELRFAHNYNTLDKIDKFIADDNHDVAEIDVRIDEEGLYVSHNIGRKSDLDPEIIYERVVTAPRPKALKYDIKEPEAVRGIIDSIVDRKRPCILNADLIHNAQFNLTPEQFVEQGQGLTNAILSIGRKGDFGNIGDFVWQFIQLARNHPKTDFILPAHLIDFLGSFDKLQEALLAPNAFLMVYRTGDFPLTKRHIKWIQEKFDPVKHPELLVNTFFDL